MKRRLQQTSMFWDKATSNAVFYTTENTYLRLIVVGINTFQIHSNQTPSPTDSQTNNYFIFEFIYILFFIVDTIRSVPHFLPFCPPLLSPHPFLCALRPCYCLTSWAMHICSLANPFPTFIQPPPSHSILRFISLFHVSMLVVLFINF